MGDSNGVGNLMVLKTHAKISPTEKNESLKSNTFNKVALFFKQIILFPNSPNKVAWDFFVGILIMYSVTVIPFRIGFFVEKKLAAVVFDVFVDICFAFDMIATFFTAFEDDGKLNINHRDIAKNYLSAWFFPDLISTVPFDSIVPLIVHGVAPGTLRSIKLVRALRLFRLLKLFRVARLNRKMAEAKVVEIIHPIVYELGGLFSRIFVIAHILACMFYYISGCHHGEYDDDQFNDNELNLEEWRECGHEGDMYSHYLLSVYWTMATMLSVGYGEVVLVNNPGRLYSVFVMFVGSITFGFIVATVSESVKNWDPRETARKLKMDEIREYMTEKSLPKVLKNKVWKHFEYYYNKLSTFPEDVILDSMPIMLQQLVLEKTRGDLSSFKLFRKEDYGTLSQVLPHLRPTFAEPHTCVVREGDYCVDMFFVVRGCVHASQQNAKTSNRQVLVGIFADGSDFGVSNALKCDSTSWATYRATVLTDLMWLSYQHVQRISKRSEIMHKVFEERLEEELDGQIEVSKHLNKTEEVNLLRVPAFIICDGLVISCRHAIRMLGEDAVRPKVSRIYKTVTIMGKDANGEDVYQENQETTQQMWDRWVINPQCQKKVIFDLVVGMFVLMSAITLPYRLGFGIPTDTAWSAADAVTEALFFIDLVASFFTAYEQSDYVLNTVHKNIARRYLKSWFVVDFVSTIPLYRISEGGDGAAILRLLKTLKMGRMMRILRLLRLARLVKLVRVVSSDTSKFNSDFVAFEDVFSRICKLIAFLGFVTHLTACFWSWCSLRVNGPNWHDAIGIDDKEYAQKYIAAVYWTYATMATVGYGDVIAMNDGERLFSVFVMVMGSTILAYIVGTVSTQAFNKNGGKGLQEQKLSLVRDYLAEQGTPRSLREAVMKHFCFALEKKTAFDESKIWRHLPHCHRQEVVMCVHRTSMERLPMFVKVKDTIMTAIHAYMEPCLAMSGTYVYNFETGSGGIYFILRGTAEVVDEDEDEAEVIVASIRAGMFFGHEKFLDLCTDFVGIRARTDLSMLMISDEHVALLKLQMPLAYNALVSLLQEALKVSTTIPVPGPQAGERTRRSFLRSLSSAAESSVRDLLGLPSHKLMKKTAQAQTIKRNKSSVEEFFEWFSGDMDESTWIKKSNISHFKHRISGKEEGANFNTVSPSSVLSMNSKDRYKAMKREKAALNKSESGESNSSGSPADRSAMKEMLLHSGRSSYADLYGVRSEKSERSVTEPDGILNMPQGVEKGAYNRIESVEEKPQEEEDDACAQMTTTVPYNQKDAAVVSDENQEPSSKRERSYMKISSFEAPNS